MPEPLFPAPNTPASVRDLGTPRPLPNMGASIRDLPPAQATPEPAQPEKVGLLKRIGRGLKNMGSRLGSAFHAEDATAVQAPNLRQGAYGVAQAAVNTTEDVANHALNTALQKVNPIDRLVRVKVEIDLLPQDDVRAPNIPATQTANAPTKNKTR